MMRTALMILLLTGALLAPSALRGAPLTYSVTDIGLLPGFVSITATSVDAEGEATGRTTFADGARQ
jgi:hypothetical protein